MKKHVTVKDRLVNGSLRLRDKNHHIGVTDKLYAQLVSIRIQEELCNLNDTIQWLVESYHDQRR